MSEQEEFDPKLEPHPDDTSEVDYFDDLPPELQAYLLEAEGEGEEPEVIPTPEPPQPPAEPEHPAAPAVDQQPEVEVAVAEPVAEPELESELEKHGLERTKDGSGFIIRYEGDSGERRAIKLEVSEVPYVTLNYNKMSGDYLQPTKIIISGIELTHKEEQNIGAGAKINLACTIIGDPGQFNFSTNLDECRDAFNYESNFTDHSV